MAIKYFCDLCNREVERKVQLTGISMPLIEAEEARGYNRYDIHKYTTQTNHEICIYCRIEIMDKIKSMIDASKVQQG